MTNITREQLQNYYNQREHGYYSSAIGRLQIEGVHQYWLTNLKFKSWENLEDNIEILKLLNL